MSRSRAREQQAAAGTHKVRELLVKQRTALSNARRGLMAEFGVIAAARPRHVGELIALLSDPAGKRIPAPLHSALVAMGEALGGLERRIAIVDKPILVWGRGNRTCRHRITIPGYGPILASAMAAIVVEPKAFQSGRPFAASLGLVPPGRHRRQELAPAKAGVRLGPISKRGNGYLRRLLVSGAMAVLNGKRAKRDAWLVKLLADKKRMVVAGALANKMARIAWAVMTRQEDFRPMPVVG